MNNPTLLRNGKDKITIKRMEAWNMDGRLYSESDHIKPGKYKLTDSTNIYINEIIGGTIRWCIPENGIIEISYLKMRNEEMESRFYIQLIDWASTNGIHQIIKEDGEVILISITSKPHTLDLVDNYRYIIEKLIKNDIEL